MPWNKPYHPARNQRLVRELYTYAHGIYFMTIRGYQHQRPFMRDDLNKTLIILCALKRVCWRLTSTF